MLVLQRLLFSIQYHSLMCVTDVKLQCSDSTVCSACYMDFKQQESAILTHPNGNKICLNVNSVYLSLCEAVNVCSVVESLFEQTFRLLNFVSW